MRAERFDDLRDLGLDRFQRRDDLGDALSGDILKTARLVNSRDSVLQFRGGLRRNRARDRLHGLAAFQDRVGRARGMLHDRVQLIGGEWDVAIRDVADPQRRDFLFREGDRAAQSLDLVQQQCFSRAQISAHCGQHGLYDLRHHVPIDRRVAPPRRRQLLLRAVSRAKSQLPNAVTHVPAPFRSCPLTFRR